MRRLAILLVPLVGLSACGRPMPTAMGPGPRHVLAVAPGVTIDVPAEPQALGLTVYADGPGLVSDTRKVALPAGTVTLRFMGVSPQFEVGSARLLAPRGEKAPDVHAQSFTADVVTASRLLERFVGKEIEVRMPAEGDQPAKLVKATLLSTDGPVVRIAEKVYLKPPGEIVLPEVPAGTPTSPTLSWQLTSPTAYDGPLTAAYITGGLAWTADYELTLGAGGKAALLGWASVANNTGVDFPDTRLTVVAGALNRKSPVYPIDARYRAVPAPNAGGAFAMSSLGEFHRYDLAGKVSLPKNETRQLRLLKADEVPVVKRLRFESSMGQVDEQPRAAEATLTFVNKAENGLGVPLPSGRVRIYQGTALLGEDRMANTPKDETVRLGLGEAFDVVGERKQVASTRPEEHVREETYSVTLRNHKAAAVSVDVVEQPYGAWTIADPSTPFKAVSTTQVVFPVRVPANGETVVKYTIRFKEP